jgi:outer membrane protein assembly factor BamB
MVTVSRAGRRGLFVCIAIAVTAGLAAAAEATTSVRAASVGSVKSGEWPLPGANAENTRDVPSPITSANVGSLTQAWSVPIQAQGAFGTFASTPIVVNGVVYAQDIDSNVYAIDLSTGKLLWFQKYGSADAGPNGIAVANVDGTETVYGATATEVFAIQAATGEQLWAKNITINKESGIDMAPGVNHGVVYVSTVPGTVKTFSSGKGQAILFALNAKTGDTIWRWNEDKKSWLKPNEGINSGGGQWYPPSFDSQGNVYVGTANPDPTPGTAQSPFGSSRPGKDLYTDSIVKLNHKTGKVMWYYQLTPHDINDWDLQDSPILTTVHGKGVAIGAGKAGIVVAVSQKTGKLLWKTPVGMHNGHDNDGLLSLSQAEQKLVFPYTVYPGILGGVESPMASDGTTVYAAVNNLGATFTSNLETGIETGNVFAGTGVMVALDQATGKVLWQHDFTSSPYGGAVVTNDVVFTTTFNGMLWALNAKTGAVLWQTQLSAGTNATVIVAGGYVITASSLPLSQTQSANIVAYHLPAS